jgi:hypothetical protein
MDRALFAACLSTATTIVANTGNLVNMHHAFAKSVVVDAAFELYDELEQLITQREAAEKALEEADFAQRIAERAEADRVSSASPSEKDI